MKVFIPHCSLDEGEDLAKESKSKVTGEGKAQSLGVEGDSDRHVPQSGEGRTRKMEPQPPQELKKVVCGSE